jgi:glycosyltransferase involved in cell wall biosynthesis
LLALGKALRSIGVAATIRAPEDDSLAEFDCLHLFGSLPEHRDTVALARRRGKPVVLSTIAWFDLAARWHEGLPPLARARATVGYLLRAALPRWPDWRRRLYRSVDRLLPNSQAEADQLRELLAIPAQQIRVVPNGADPRLAQAAPKPFHARYGLTDFVLYAGRIEPRKNQLGFLRAMRGAGLPIVVLGDAVPGHQRYAEQCRAAADERVTFIGRIPHHDPLLASAYAACRCLALVSWFETPGLVALEAGMTGTPLVLTGRGATGEYFGRFATYVNPADDSAIRQAVLDAFDRPRDPRLAHHVATHYAWRAAAEAMLEVYRDVV